MDSSTRLDGRGPVGPCLGLGLVDLSQSHRAKGTRHTLGCQHQHPNQMLGDKLKIILPKIPFKIFWAVGASI